jgi:hypothetical protein
MSRRLRSTLPVATTKLDPSLINSSTFRSSRENEQERQQNYFNRNAKNLPSLAIGETVRLRKILIQSGRWLLMWRNYQLREVIYSKLKMDQDIEETEFTYARLTRDLYKQTIQTKWRILCQQPSPKHNLRYRARAPQLTLPQRRLPRKQVAIWKSDQP